MAIAAHLEESAQGPGTPRAPRRKLCLETQGARADGEPAEVLVHDISATGLLLETGAALATGEEIAVGLPETGSCSARIVWTSGRLFGCQFSAPVSAATLSAAQLRGAAGFEPAARPERQEPFSLRLARLRRERGLTLARVAHELGVSKPTVWAWEQGKARPVESRIEAIAALLGVSAPELLSGRDGTGLEGTLARSRAQIARAFGTSPANVRIMIEL